MATSFNGNAAPQFFIGSDQKAMKLREKNREVKNMKNYRAIKQVFPTVMSNSIDYTSR